MIPALDPQTYQAAELLAVDLGTSSDRMATGLLSLIRRQALTEEYCAAIAETARAIASQADALEQRIAALRAKEAGDV